MKDHILTALKEKFMEWQDLLDTLDEEQVLLAEEPGEWSVKDILAHLWAWQQLTQARLKAALQGGEPVFSLWPAELEESADESPDEINAWIYSHYLSTPWPEIRKYWQECFQNILDLAIKLPERELLDSEKYPWLKGYPLVNIFIATYDHHQEHYEKLLAKLDNEA